MKPLKRTAVALALAGGLAFALAQLPRAAAESDPGSSGFALKFQGEVSPLPLISAFVMPGETLEVEAVGGPVAARLEAQAEAGRLVRAGARRWRWHAPKTPGPADLVVRDAASRRALGLRVFVLVPYDGSEVLNGYRIGRYEPTPLRGDPAYRVPRGLVEVLPVHRELLVSPHFRLDQFLCKQEGEGDPVYLALSTRLLLALETLLAAFREHGIQADTLTVMSGYRTPHYNRTIGNDSRYTRHAYGDAADVFVDADGDGWMDDLDGDGNVGVEDARRLYEIVDALHGEPRFEPFVGGLGLYGPAPHRGPFVHVDTRGRRARW